MIKLVNLIDFFVNKVVVSKPEFRQFAFVLAGHPRRVIF
jgi:hypothetical protein